MTEQLNRHHDQLARDIVALLFWRWRATLHTLDMYTQQPGTGIIDIPIFALGREAQAYYDFIAARNAYYGKWN